MKAAGYARYSSDNQQHESIEAQSQAIRKYCLENNYDLVKIYADEAISGKTDQRAEFLQMIHDAKAGLFDIVIVHKLDRFARNRYDSAIYKRELKNNGVSVYSILEKLDDSPESILLEALYEGMAEFYSANLSREVRTKSLVHAQQARHMGGIPPLGYDLTPDKKYIINTVEAAAVREIFELYCTGFGYGSIADRLNAKGYKTKAGKIFTKNSIMDILINEKYIGRYVYNKRLSKTSGNRKYKSDDEIIRIENALPRIIDDKQWDMVQKKLQSRKNGPRMSAATRVYILTGKMECAECGAPYVGGSYYFTRNREKIQQYVCMGRKRKLGCKNKNIRADAIENYVIDKIKKEILSDAAMKNLLIEIDGVINAQTDINQQERNNLIKRKAQVENKINKTFELYYADGMDKEMVSTKMAELKESLTQIETQIEQNRIAILSVSHLEEIRKMLVSFRAAFDETDPMILKTAIDTFVQKVLIYYDDVKVIFKINIPPTPPEKRGVSDKVGGGEGSRTPVRKPVHRTFYKLSGKDLFPYAPSFSRICAQVAS